MKRLLLGAAIVAVSGPAWGQVQADYNSTIAKDKTCLLEAENGCIHYKHHPSFKLSDQIVTVATRSDIQKRMNLQPLCQS